MLRTTFRVFHTQVLPVLYSPFLPTGALGHGSSRCGGAASTTDGHFLAFGNTEEALRALVYGQVTHGAPADGPFDRTTGCGWVRAEDGQYADALRKGHAVMLLGMESTGALFPPFALHLQLLGRQSTMPGTVDTTRYGAARASPSSFYRHHSASIAAAVVFADAHTVLTAAASMSFELTLAPPANRHSHLKVGP